MVAAVGSPGPREAAEIAASWAAGVPRSVHRFPTGIGHWVYDVVAADGRKLVVRIGASDQRPDFVGARYWSGTLRPLGVPLPALLADGELRGLPYLVLERLPGDDLGNVISSLGAESVRSIADEVCRIQRLVGTLPRGPGFGFARLPPDACLPNWAAVVEQLLARSRARIGAAGVCGPAGLERVEARAGRFARYFAGIEPRAFLDDTTTKNVIVHEGRLSGIVDVDWICYGDPLFTLGLTRMALLNAGLSLDYAEHWAAQLELSSEQLDALAFYTALFCVGFMSELGHAFNRGEAEVDPERPSLLERILERCLESF